MTPELPAVGRAEALAEIVRRHGTEALYVVAAGYLAGALREVVGERATVLYLPAGAGLAPAVGLGVALAARREVVVINGDAALLASLGTTHTLRDRAPAHFFHYVLDNGGRESAGERPSPRLEGAYSGVTEILAVTRDGAPGRSAPAPSANAAEVRDFLARPLAPGGAATAQARPPLELVVLPPGVSPRRRRG